MNPRRILHAPETPPRKPSKSPIPVDRANSCLKTIYSQPFLKSQASLFEK